MWFCVVVEVVVVLFCVVVVVVFVMCCGCDRGCVVF